jgi:zinc D-Ala-D-Ala dipeptidase
LKFIDVTKLGFVAEPRYFFYGWTREPRILARKSAALALKRAEKLLPAGYRFKIWDFQRPRYVQLNMIASFRRRMQVAHPKWGTKRLEKEILRFAAAPLPDKLVTRRDCHRKGGAVDLTIIDNRGNELYMGTDHDDLTAKAATDYFEKIKKPNALELEARKNRRLLTKVMEKSGWENYPPEWWHWSITK